MEVWRAEWSGLTELEARVVLARDSAAAAEAQEMAHSQELRLECEELERLEECRMCEAHRLRELADQTESAALDVLGLLDFRRNEVRQLELSTTAGRGPLRRNSIVAVAQELDGLKKARHHQVARSSESPPSSADREVPHLRFELQEVAEEMALMEQSCAARLPRGGPESASLAEALQWHTKAAEEEVAARHASRAAEQETVRELQELLLWKERQLREVAASSKEASRRGASDCALLGHAIHEMGRRYHRLQVWYAAHSCEGQEADDVSQAGSQ